MEFSLQRIDIVNINTLDSTKEYNSLSELYKNIFFVDVKATNNFWKLYV